MRRLTFLGVTAALAAGLTGCGGSSTTTTRVTTATPGDTRTADRKSKADVEAMLKAEEFTDVTLADDADGNYGGTAM